MKTLYVRAPVAAFALFTAPVYAQCTLDMTYGVCINANSFEAAAKAGANDDVGEMNTGASDSVSLQDFISKLGFALDVTNFGANGDMPLAFNWNGFVKDIVATFYDGFAKSAWNSVEQKLTVRINEPRLFEPLATTLSAEQKDQLEKEVTDDSDRTVVLSFSPAGRRFGRRLAPFGDAFSSLFQENIGQILRTYAASNGTLTPFNELNRSIGDLELDTMTLRDIRDACRMRAGCVPANVDVIVAAANEQTESVEEAIEGALGKGVFKTWQQLLGNQPQLVLALEHTSRDTLAGRNTSSARLGWEYAKYNMSDFLEFRGDGSACGTMTACLLTYGHDNAAGIESAVRYAVSLEYVSNDGFEFAHAAMPALQLDREDSFVFTAAASRNFYLRKLIPGGESGGKPARGELSLAYDDADNDPQRNDRFLAKFTFSQELADGVALTLGFVYSSKPEYRGEVDHEFSGRFGVNYKYGSNKQ